MNGQLIRFPLSQAGLSTVAAQMLAAEILLTAKEERGSKTSEMEDPELLLAMCDLLRSRFEAVPGTVREEAEFFYRFLEKPPRRVGSFDERDYFLGELALIAGTACRFLFRKEESRRWFDRAEARFVVAHNTGANLARLAYQRLALTIEERRFDEILEFAPAWTANLRSLGLPEEAIKCRFLEGLALRETRRFEEAKQEFVSIAGDALAAGRKKLTGQALNNLAQICRVLGDLEGALTYAQEALPLLKETEELVGLAKLRWCVGDILREQSKPAEALDAYRAALLEAESIGIRGDVAAIHLVIADLLLEVGHEAQAEWEIRAALPIIEEENMVPEGMAALTLLHESLRRRQINRQALRDLHGYFQDNA